MVKRERERERPQNASFFIIINPLNGLEVASFVLKKDQRKRFRQNERKKDKEEKESKWPVT